MRDSVMALKPRTDRNLQHLTVWLDWARVFHPIFAQSGIVDLIACYAADFFPRYARIPPHVHVLDYATTHLFENLTRRRGAAKLRTYDKELLESHYWDCLDLAWPYMRVGQVGAFTNAKTRGKSAFVVVWKHPRPDVHVFGAVFPFVSMKSPEYSVSPRPTPVFGADLSAREWRRWRRSSIHRLKKSCSCWKRKHGGDHGAMCDAWSTGADLEEEGLKRGRTPPADGLYRVHYFGLWTSDLDVLQSSLCWEHVIRVELLDPDRNLRGSCHFATCYGGGNEEQTYKLHDWKSTYASHPFGTSPPQIRTSKLPFLIDPCEINDLADYNEDDEPPTH
jgi:hypothetical protein